MFRHLPQARPTKKDRAMRTKLLAAYTAMLFLCGTIPSAHAVECAQGVKRAGCAGSNGAVAVGPNGAGATTKNGTYTTNQVHTNGTTVYRPPTTYHTTTVETYHPPAPGTTATGV